jgi:mannose-6-phosphate isomerase
VDELVAALVSAAALVDGPHYTLVAELAAAYPGDPGIAISLMLNLAELEPGQVLFLPAGNIHAYIEGLGIELMAASDNVLRGGLTPKHVDVAELLSVLDFTPVAVPYLAPVVDGAVQTFSPISDFALLHVVSDATVAVPGEAIALCTSGSFTLGSVELSAGASVYLADESPLTIAGTGDLFIATRG